MPSEPQDASVAVLPVQRVEVGRIETALAAMWSDAGASGAQAEASPGVTRAITLNLIVCATPAEDRDQLEELLSRLSERHPSRTLVILLDLAAREPRLEAYISMRCRLVGGTGKQVCGEEVTIEADGSLVEAAVIGVDALLVPDLPVYLWWKDIPHYDDNVFDRLARVADRVVIDSAAFDRPAEDLLRLAALIADPWSKLRVSDLNWSRLTPWRTVLASFWDIAEYRPSLDRIDRVAVAFSASTESTDDVAPVALLLVGWLAACLDWTAIEPDPHDDRGGALCRFRAADRTISLVVERVPVSGRGGELASISLFSDGAAASFSAALTTDGARISTRARLGDNKAHERLLAYVPHSDVDHLAGELMIQSRDTLYETAVQRVVPILRRRLGTADPDGALG